MPRRVVFLLVGVAALLGLILMMALRRQPPIIPADADHIRTHGQPKECMTCHGPQGKHPRGPNHPSGEQCWNCHFDASEQGR